MTDEQDVFDDDFDDDVAEAEAPPKSEKVVKVESKQPELVEDDEPEEPTASKDKETSVPLSALLAEREKRKAAEAKVRTQEQKPVEIPDPVTDPDGYDKYLKKTTSADRLTDKINLTADLMRDVYDDYDKYQSIFMNIVSAENDDGTLRITDPALLAKFNASVNPAKFAYQHAKKHEEFLEKSSPDYEEKVRERIRKELLDELGNKGLNPADLPNLTNVSASAKNDVHVDSPNEDVIDAFDD